MKHLIVFFFLIYCSSAFSQDDILWFNEKENLKGHVKFVHSKSEIFWAEIKKDERYSYNQLGFLVQSRLIFDMDGRSDHGIDRVFSKDGQRCLVEFYVQSGIRESRIDFTYNSKGEIVSSHYERDDFSANPHSYKYNEQGLISEIKEPLTGHDTTHIKYEYDQNARKTREYYESYSCIIDKTWKYDEKGNLVCEKSDLIKAPSTIIINVGENNDFSDKKVLDINPNDDRHYTIKYEYNNMNQIIHERYSRNFDDSIMHDKSYHYNIHGDRDTTLYNDLKTGEKEIETYVYEYDNIGNWIAKKEYYKGELSAVEQREIVYYSPPRKKKKQ